jgi:hypothetical protein
MGMNKLIQNRWVIFTAGLVLGLILGIVLDPIRLIAQKASDPPGPDPEVSWEAIPPEFSNLDVAYLSSPKNWQETEALIGALITKQMSEYPVVSEWEPAYTQGHTLWLYVAFQPVSEDTDEMLTPQGHGFLMLHHDGKKLDGYFIPIGEDYKTLVNPFGDLCVLKSSDLPGRLWQNLYERVADPSIEPLIVQNGEDLLRK